MIANCGALGIDWRAVSLAEYVEALESHNEAADLGSPRTVTVSDDLRRMMAARS